MGDAPGRSARPIRPGKAVVRVGPEPRVELVLDYYQGFTDISEGPLVCRTANRELDSLIRSL